MGRVTSKEEHGSSHTNPGSETARPLRSRKGRGRRSSSLRATLPSGVHIFDSTFCALARGLPTSRAARCDVFGDMWVTAIEHTLGNKVQ